MANRRYTMSVQEISRLEVIQQVKAREIKQIDAALRLSLSTRHLRRLTRAYEHQGGVGLVSKRCGKPSNRRIGESIKAKAIELIKSHYPDFSPTLAHEKLTEVHGLSFSLETLRQWMIDAELWQGKKRRKARIHQQRARRSSRGELVQIDGSPHDWFEGRREKCCLLVFIDDATSELLTLHFVEQECLQGYFDSIEKHLKKHGIPKAYYSDKHSIFRVPIKEAKSGDGKTQLGRALSELDIELICANTPQAKGRVEKANQTLQDRLVKELRLQNISDINTANAFLPKFIKDYNHRFAVEPQSTVDAHRPFTKTDKQLKLILCGKYTRKVSKNLEVHYDNKVFQIKTKTNPYSLRNASITVCDKQGEIRLLYRGKSLSYAVFDKHNKPALVADSKQIQQGKPSLKPPKPTYRPKADHPWKGRHRLKQPSAAVA